MLGRIAISAADAPMKAPAFARVVSTIPYQARQSAEPRSRTFSTCAVDRVGHAPGQGRHGGVVEMDEVPADRELAVEGGGGEVEAHRLRIFL